MTDQPVNIPSEGQPASQAGGSGATGVQSLGKQLVELLKTDKELRDAVYGAAYRGEKSQNDKRFVKLEEQLARLSALEQGGLQRPAALRMMELEDRLNEMTDNRAAPPVPAGNLGHSAPNVDYSLHLSALDLDPNDPEVVSTVRAGGDVAANLAKLKVQRKAAPANLPNPATVMPTGAGQPQSSPDLQSQYQAELSKVRRGDIDALFQLKQKYRKQGLQI